MFAVDLERLKLIKMTIKNVNQNDLITLPEYNPKYVLYVI